MRRDVFVTWRRTEVMQASFLDRLIRLDANVSEHNAATVVTGTV